MNRAFQKRDTMVHEHPSSVKLLTTFCEHYLTKEALVLIDHYLDLVPEGFFLDSKNYLPLEAMFVGEECAKELSKETMSEAERT